MEDTSEMCITLLEKLKNTGRSYSAFNELHTILREEASSHGLSDRMIELIVDIIMNSNLGSVKLALLIKCMTPIHKVPVEPAKLLITWCLANSSSIPITLSTLIIQWIVGLHEFQLLDRDTINMFYDVFFHVMLKREKLERHIAYLIYVLSKPEDVTRRAVSRLLAHKAAQAKPPKHIIAILSLFKSYKPEMVPERIPSMNVQSVWKPIPEILRLRFQEAKDRAEVNGNQNDGEDFFNWNPFEASRTQSRKTAKPLIPSVGYFQIGSNIFKPEEAKTIFDVSSFEDLGKYQQDVELPSNFVSLLSNMAGYHLLVYTNSESQSRFVYNLFNALKIGFIQENGKFSVGEMEKLLNMTAEFSRYMQHGLLVVQLFFNEYMSLRTGEHETSLLALLEWMLTLSVDDLRDTVSDHVQSIYFTSGLNMKCLVIGTLKRLITNMFVDQEFAKADEETPVTPFFGQAPGDNLEDIHPALVKFAERLIVNGLHIHSYNSKMLAEALRFYEEISILEERSDKQLFSLAPAALIYGSFVNKSCAILSQVCKLLTRYHKRVQDLKQSGPSELYERINAELSTYTNDIMSALWYNKTFSDSEKPRFVKAFPKKYLSHFAECNFEELLNISNHYAILPYIAVLSKGNLHLDTTEDFFYLAKVYYPAVSDFLWAYLDALED